jgi:hypothetical protein
MMTESVKFLAHQRPSDIAMIEQVLVSMEEFGSANDDALSKQSAELLRGLLSIESQADSLEPQHQSNGSIYAQTSQATWAAHNEANSTVHISIPYFGIVNVSRNGIIWRNGDSKIHGSRVVPEQPPMVAAQNTETAPLGATRAPAGDISSGYGSITWKSETNGNLETRQLDLSSGSDENSAAMKLLEHSSGPSATLRGGHFSRTDALPQLSTASTELLLQNEYPTMTAGADEWAFQGVDMAFFDILLRDSADFGSESA